MQTNTEKMSDAHCCKVGSLQREYDITEMDQELVMKWRGEKTEQKSIRELTEEFNKQLLRTALDRGEIDYLEGEVNNTYRLLTDEDVTEGVQVNVRRALKRQKVDIEATEEDFVSHQTVYNHLTTCLNVSKPDEEAQDPVEKSASQMFSLQNRTVAVVDSKLKQLRNNDHLSLGEFDAFVDINVFCRECETRHELGQLLRSGGCSCQKNE